MLTAIAETRRQSVDANHIAIFIIPFPGNIRNFRFLFKNFFVFGATKNFTSNVQGKSQIRACIAVVKVIAASLCENADRP
jgi:hypothetical protein